VVVLYMQLAYTLRSGRMTRSDGFFNKVMARRPAVGNAMGLVFSLAGVCLAGAIVWNAWPKFLTAWREGFYVGIIGVFTFPEWPLLLAIFVGCVLTGLQFVLIAIRHALALAGVASGEPAGDPPAAGGGH
jgi:TRAP-type mannitol/chloroaromatic compound transport system permease small subunit